MRLAAVIGALVLAAAIPAAADEPVTEVGKPFPIVSLPLAGSELERHSLELYRGRKLMLHLFASW